MKKILAKIPFISRFFADDDSEWRSPTSTLDVVSKEELDQIQRETLETLHKENVMNPKALFYIYKYIDAKFDKKDFDIDSRFVKKANKLDQLYAEGYAEVYTEFTGYDELMERAKEADRRLRRSIMALDPETDISTEECKIVDDTNELKTRFNQLATKLEWKEQ